jgi:hypothetical protein
MRELRPRAPTRAQRALDPHRLACVAMVRMALHTVDGARKYLTASERDAFLRRRKTPIVRCGRFA